MRQGFTIHHNGPDVGLAGKRHTACIAYWEAVREYHQQRWPSMNDIAYSFGMCPHGIRFEGRGWDRLQFANGSDQVGVDDGKDSEWFSVLVFLGWNDDADHPVDEEPTDAMIEGVANLIEEGRHTKRCGFRVLPHNAFKQKRCPGATFTRLAGEWNNQPIDTEDDMSAQDIADIKDRLGDIARKLNELHPFPAEKLTIGGVRSDDGKPAARTIRWQAEAVTLLRAISGDDDVDEGEVAAIILAKLTPEAIVAAMDEDLAEQVVEELKRRLDA